MSIVFLKFFITSGQTLIDAGAGTAMQYMIAWALFSIADGLWLRTVIELLKETGHKPRAVFKQHPSDDGDDRDNQIKNTKRAILFIAAFLFGTILVKLIKLFL